MSLKSQQDCANGECYCKTRLAIQKLTNAISMTELSQITGETMRKTNACITNLENYDAICRDRNMICPDNP